MSASVGVYVATALFLAIGGDTEEPMKHDVWRQSGLCDRYCHWEDESPECRRQIMRNLPCVVNRAADQFWYDYRHEPERGWDPRNMPLVEKPLVAPDWVQSDQPTPYPGSDVGWLKLRL